MQCSKSGSNDDAICVFKTPSRVFWSNATDSSSYYNTVSQLQAIGLFDKQQKIAVIPAQKKVKKKMGQRVGIRRNMATLFVINERNKKKNTK